jgi:hypothetical protein
MGFDAGTVVEPLDWDFVKVTKNPEDKGTIPEPTDKAIDKMFTELQKLASSLAKRLQVTQPEETTPEKMLEGLANLPDEAEEPEFGLEEYLTGMNRIYAELCQNQPSEEQLSRLPLRIRVKFYSWLTSELRPNVFGGASTNAAPNLRIVKPA